MTDLRITAHDKDMARDFLAGLDPNAGRFTFQFFGDDAGEKLKVLKDRRVA